MPAIDGLIEVGGRAAQAEGTARAATWLDQSAVDAAAARVAASLAGDREALAQPGLSALLPSAVWRQRLAELGAVDRDAGVELPSEDPIAAAAQAEADAEAAVTVARLTLIEAHLAVLRARSAMLRAGDSTAVAEAVRAYRPLRSGSLAARYGHAVGTGTRTELAHVVVSRPRPILVKLAIGLGLGLAYLVFLRLFHWDTKSELLPYLAPYALSGVIGGVVCTNALSWDAGRVRASLTGGQRLWLVLLNKNLSMFVLVGTVGIILSIVFAWGANDFGALLRALGELATMMLIWLGVGNVLSVLMPLRVEPLKARLHDGTWKPYLLSFVISYLVGLGVSLIITWKVWAKQSMINELGGAWVPVLLLVTAAAVTYFLLTVLAVSIADLPLSRRKLLREMVDYRANKAPRHGQAVADSP